MNAATTAQYTVAGATAPDTRVFTGAEKAAALLLTMGKPPAARMLKHFDPLELRQITRAAANLGAVSNAAIEALVEEFTDSFSAGVDLMGTAGEAEQLLTGALPPDQVADILSDVLGSSNSGLWEKLANLPEATFVAYLEKEHPQVTTFVLSKLASSYVAKVVTLLRRDLRNDILRRMMAPESASDEALRIVEGVLQAELLNASVSVSSGDNKSRIADIVNKLDQAEADDVMRTLEEASPKDAAALRKMLFSFDDLLRLSARARATLFDKVPTDTIVMALRGTDANFRDAVLSSMASRARRLVEGELNNGAAPPQREVAKARRAIADLVLKLAQQNEIEISTADSSDTE